jgi:hypothetical protein
MRWLRRVSVTAGGLLLAGSLAQGSAMAATSSASSASAPASVAQATTSTGQSASKTVAKAAPGPAQLSDPAKVLPSGWQRSSDEAVTVSGDATGLHVLAASEASGYAWRTVATLGDPAVETDLWVGQACVTAAGRYAVVVYAPEQAANMAGAQGVLGRAAIVNLRTGAVKDLGGGFSIAYFDPGCGAGGDAVLTKGGWANDGGGGPMSTTLVVADAATGQVSAPVKVAGQVTSAVPFDGQIAAAGGRGVEQVGLSGRTRLLAAAPGVPFRLAPGAGGSLGYQVMAGAKVDLWQLAGGRARRVGSAAAGSVELRQIGGRTWLVGPRASKVAGLPRSWQPVDAPAVAQPSSTGTLAVTGAEAVAPVKGQHYDPAAAQPVTVSAVLLAGKRGGASFKVATAAAPAAGTATAAGTGAGARAAKTVTTTALIRPATTTPGSPSTPVSADRTCAVALDDPTIQAYQPTFQQVEWAADQAVQGTLTDSRPAGLYGSSLSAYTPQGSSGLFPLPAVDGGGHLPAQVLLGVLTAESNLQQASMHVIQGQAANPLTSFNWYGNWTNGETDNTGLINWSKSDCGYGIGQITSGMCMAGNPNNNDECAGQESTTLSAEQQLAVAVDYQANIAAAARLLILDWNNLYTLGITPTDGIPNGQWVLDSNKADYIGMWYMAIWAYNSGLEPGSPNLGNTTGCSPSPSCHDGDGNWGLGYADNPINPAYPPDRPNFPATSSNTTPTGATYSPDWDMSHPQYWPYQEKVNGWAFDSITLWDYSQGKDVQAFAYAPGNSAVATFDTFCVPGAGGLATTSTPGDNCNSSAVSYSSPTAPDSCQLTGSTYGDHCWWHWPASVNPTTITHGETASCVLNLDCGKGVTTYASGAAIPATEPIAAQFAQTCASTLPSTAVIVGDGGKSALGCPGENWTSQGSFTWNFAKDANGNYSSKIDFDQIGAGFGGHFWFGYTQPSNAASDSSIVANSAHSNQVITGTWKPPSSVTGWTDVQVAIPSYGADAPNANYRVTASSSLPTRNVQVDQDATTGANTWVNLGDFDLGSGASVSLSNVTFGGTGVDIAWSAMAFTPVSDPTVNYVAMGDSYSSGEGNSPYFPDSNTSTDMCHRSMEGAYPMMVTLPGETEPIANQTSDGFNFIACSGAETTGVAAAAVNPAGNPDEYYVAANPNENQYNVACNTDWGYVQNNSQCTKTSNPSGPVEGLQVINSALNDSTSLVTLSIGGNDSRFADVILGCLKAALPLSGTDCSNSNFVLTRNSTSATDPAPLEQFETTVISYLEAHLVQTYLAINTAAPNAQIVVVGYPLVFAAKPTSPCNSGTYQGTLTKLSVNAQEMLNQFGNDMNTAISSAVQNVQEDGVDIQFVNPTAAFTGHDICGGSSWFLPLSLTTQASSYHPNVAGQTAFATLVNECLEGKISTCT